MIILYGNNNVFKDVTSYFIKDEDIIIPYSDVERANIYGDPLFGIVKIIKITDDYNNVEIIKDNESITLKKDSNNKYNLKNKIYNIINQPVDEEQKYKDILSNIHNQITINHGNKMDEYPEQLMSVTFINPNDCVLEIGGNIGRNSCTIAKILNDSNNLLVIESDPSSVAKLEENKNINSLNFKIEGSAISKVPLMQNNWNTKTINNNEIQCGWSLINTITWTDLKQKYNMNFNVLVVDCEGALYYILKEEPDFLNDFKTIIIENDFTDIQHKQFVDDEFKRYNFKNIYKQSGGFGPCYNCFYEVWNK
jgi:FkbM family methyltransferase